MRRVSESRDMPSFVVSRGHLHNWDGVLMLCFASIGAEIACLCPIRRVRLEGGEACKSVRARSSADPSSWALL